jgi:hypothetical protein
VTAYGEAIHGARCIWGAVQCAGICTSMRYLWESIGSTLHLPESRKVSANAGCSISTVSNRDACHLANISIARQPGKASNPHVA